MNENDRWVVLDVETDGLMDPIYVVEIAAQHMEGWTPVGEPFRMLLDHGVPIDPGVSAIHGYTQEYLREFGSAPVLVHGKFREYVRGCPLVAHNLAFDWNRCLAPEWERLGVEPCGRRGFCALTLARRVVHECKSFRLDVLKDVFGVDTGTAHRGLNDVAALVRLIADVYAARVFHAGVVGFEAVSEFSRLTPVAKCLARVKKADPSGKNEWYYLDSNSNAHGPFPAATARQHAQTDAFLVWRAGLREWVLSTDCDDFGFDLCKVEVCQPSAKEKTSDELLGILRGIVSDGKIANKEIDFLSGWLENAECATEWPGTQIVEVVERILLDGHVSKEEKDELKKVIDDVLSRS